MFCYAYEGEKARRIRDLERWVYCYVDTGGDDECKALESDIRTCDGADGEEIGRGSGLKIW